MKFAAALFAAAILAAQTPEPASIDGRVFNPATGVGIADVTVMLESSPLTGYWTSSDSEGRFRMPDLEPGSYTLSVDRGGFASKSNIALRLTAGQQLTGVEVRMVPQAVIAGRVVDENGKPLRGVTVYLQKPTYRNGRRELAPLRGVFTDDRGQYRLFGLQPGRYAIAARKENSGWAPAYYPATSDPNRAEPLDLAPGDVRSGIDMTIVRSATHSVRGTVVNRTGVPIQTGIVVLISPLVQNAAELDEHTGAFTFDAVVAGHYELSAAIVGGGTAHVTRRPVDIQPDTAELSIAVYPANDVPGEVSPSGIAGVSVKLLPQTTPANAPVSARQTTSRRTSESAFGATSRTAVAGADGSFLLTKVQPDLYRVTAIGVPADRYLQAVLLGDRDVLASGIDYSEGAGGSIRVVLGDGAGSVKGKLTDAGGRAIAGASVVLVPDDAALRTIPDRYGVAHTAYDGSYTIGSLMPGAYKAFLWEEIEDGDWMDPDLRKPQQDAAPAIAVEPHSEQSLNLTLPRR